MRIRFHVLLFAALLTPALLAGCSSDSSSGGSLPAYTLQSESPPSCATVDGTTGAVTSPNGSCHVHIVLDQAYAQPLVRMAVTGQFLASQVFLLFNASNAAASDGWVIQFERGFSTATSLDVQACETEACSDNAMIDQFAGSYSLNDTFSIAAEVDRSGGANDGLRGWADTDPATTPAGDVSGTGSNTSSFGGGKVGVSIVGAKITGITVTAP